MGVRPSGNEIVPLDRLRSELAREEGHDPRFVGRVDDWGKARPDIYAGLVLSGDTIYVGFTRDAAEQLVNVRRAFAHAKIKAFTARHTFAQLRTVVDRISEELPSLRDEGIVIWSVGVDPSRNTVAVAIPEDTANTVARRLEERYGPELLTFDFSGPRYATS